MHEQPLSGKTAGPAGLFAGVSAALRGFHSAVGNRDVWRVYGRLVFALFVLTILLGGAMIYGLWTVTASDASHGMFANVGLWALRVAGIAITALAAPVISLFVLNIVFPLFAQAVFFAGMRHIHAQRAQILEKQPGLPLLTGAWVAIIRLGYFLVLTVIALLMSLIPVVGVIVGPAVQVWITAKLLGWELIDPYLDKREMRFAAQRNFVNRHSASIAGFGLPCSLVLAIPLIGPLFFGLAQAAAPVLVVDILDPTG